MVNASAVLVWSFVVLVLLVAGAFVVAVHVSQRADIQSSPSAGRSTVIACGAVVAWLALTLSLAGAGWLSFTSRPPTMGLLIAFTLGLAGALGTSRLGFSLATRIPLAALVGAQAFRFPLELMLHRAYVEGLMPVQMSYSGFNLDILTGLSAIVVALQLVRRPRSLVMVRIWNTGGIVLLANILIIALLSAPTPFRVFHNEPANVWIAHAPWVWLPTGLVVAAIVGHILVFRRLAYESRLAGSETGTSSAPGAAAAA